MSYLARTVTPANGVQTLFPVSFPFASRADVEVFVYSDPTSPGNPVAGWTWVSDGQISFAVAPTSGTFVDVRRATTITELDNTFTGGALSSAEVTANDQQLLYLEQERQDAVDGVQAQLERGVKAPVGETLSNLPPAAGRAGQFLAFDAVGDPVPASGLGADAGLRTDLAAPTGSQLVAYQAPGGQTAALHIKLRQIGNLLDYIPSIQHQDIFDRVSVVDFDTAFAEAVDELQTYGLCKMGAPAGSLHFAGTLPYPDSSLEVNGQGSNAQSSTATEFIFGSGVGGVEIKNGVTGKGSNNALRNVRLVGENVALGTNPGILLHSNMAEIDNVAVTGFGLHGLYVLSDDPTVSINANCMSVRRFRSYSNFGCGIKTEGSNSQLISFNNIDIRDNADWGYYENGFLGNTGQNMHFANNTSGDLRIGSVSRNNQFFLVYSEDIAGHIALQIDAGGGEGNIVLMSESGANLISDNSTNKQNLIWWRDGGSKFNRVIVGSAGGVGITIDELKALLPRGAEIQLQDDPLTANAFIKMVAGKLQLQHGSGTNTWNLGSAVPVVAGSRGGNAALASLLTALAGIGFISDTTTA